MSECVLGTRVSCTEIAESIEILFGTDSQNHVLDGRTFFGGGVQIPRGKGHIRGRHVTRDSVWDSLAKPCIK